MNVKKTKTIVIRQNVKSRCDIEIKVDDKILDQVKQYYDYTLGTSLLKTENVKKKIHIHGIWGLVDFKIISSKVQYSEYTC